MPVLKHLMFYSQEVSKTTSNSDATIACGFGRFLHKSKSPFWQKFALHRMHKTCVVLSINSGNG